MWSHYLATEKQTSFDPIFCWQLAVFTFTIPKPHSGNCPRYSLLMRCIDSLSNLSHSGDSSFDSLMTNKYKDIFVLFHVLIKIHIRFPGPFGGLMLWLGCGISLGTLHIFQLSVLLDALSSNLRIPAPFMVPSLNSYWFWKNLFTKFLLWSLF